METSDIIRESFKRFFKLYTEDEGYCDDVTWALEEKYSPLALSDVKKKEMVRNIYKEVMETLVEMERDREMSKSNPV